jgi:hypothetical protein
VKIKIKSNYHADTFFYPIVYLHPGLPLPTENVVDEINILPLIFGLLMPYRVQDLGPLIYTILLQPYYSRVVVFYIKISYMFLLLVFDNIPGNILSKVDYTKEHYNV